MPVSIMPVMVSCVAPLRGMAPRHSRELSRNMPQRSVSIGAACARDAARCHLLSQHWECCTSRGADPLVRGRRPRRPWPAGTTLILLARSGSRGTRADQGSAPQFVQQDSYGLARKRFGLGVALSGAENVKSIRITVFFGSGPRPSGAIEDPPQAEQGERDRARLGDHKLDRVLACDEIAYRGRAVQ